MQMYTRLLKFITVCGEGYIGYYSTLNKGNYNLYENARRTFVQSGSSIKARSVYTRKQVLEPERQDT